MDLIDREQLMNYIRSKKINIGKLAHDVIMKQPSIQIQEPKTGHWKIIPFSNNYGEYRPKEYVCSECGWKIDLCRGLQQDTGHRLFCEHCGAKMVEPQEREDEE